MAAKINNPDALSLIARYSRSVKEEFQSNLFQIHDEHIRECLRILWDESHQPSNDWLPTHGVDYGD